MYILSYWYITILYSPQCISPRILNFIKKIAKFWKIKLLNFCKALTEELPKFFKLFKLLKLIWVLTLPIDLMAKSLLEFVLYTSSLFYFILSASFLFGLVLNASSLFGLVTHCFSIRIIILIGNFLFNSLLW